MDNIRWFLDFMFSGFWKFIGCFYLLALLGTFIVHFIKAFIPSITINKRGCDNDAHRD